MVKLNFMYVLIGLVIIFMIITGVLGLKVLKGDKRVIVSDLETKTSEGEVTVDLTPKEFNGGKFYVDIGVNTHSVDLNGFDLKELVKLDVNGEVIKPISAPELNGHHNSGTLVFEVEDKPKNFVIKIKGLPDTNERIFEW